MELIRTYCFGDKPIHIQVVSDQKENFSHSKFQTVNFQDGNFNIAYPIFSIHGNHDDPGGEGGLSAMDLLHVSNFVNYFGKSKEVDNINIHPILIQKGNIKIALYGIGNIRDERLHRSFLYNNVNFGKVPDSEDWFKVLVLHQNRIAHGETNYIKESMIPDWFDLVVWGHEHECLITPQPTENFAIVQPGSSVATSLCEGEARTKCVGILEISYSTEDEEMRFRVVPVRLKTVRPFKMLDIVLATSNIRPDDQNAISGFLSDRVEELIHEIETDPHYNKKLPLIRLRVDYTGYNMINSSRFGQKFVGKVANPNDIITWKRQTIRRPSTRVADSTTSNFDAMIDQAEVPDVLNAMDIDKVIESFIANEISNSLEIIPESEMKETLNRFIKNKEKDVIQRFIKNTLTETQSYLAQQDSTRTNQENELHNMMVQYSRFRSNRNSADQIMRLSEEPTQLSPPVRQSNQISSPDLLPIKSDPSTTRTAYEPLNFDINIADTKKRKKSPELNQNSKKIKIKEDPIKKFVNNQRFL